MDNKRFYWIKLNTNFFNQETIDFLLQQENGCQYVVLYQMLCLSTANNNGRLETKINEVIIPYDVKKIVRDCKYFDYDTVVVALELYKKLGLVYETEDKTLRLSNYEYMIGSESANREAIKKREYRARLKAKDNLMDKHGTNCPTEYRDKSIEYRDKSIDNNINSSAKAEPNTDLAKEIIDYLNLKTNKHFRYTKNNINKIQTRLKEKFTLDDFKTVIDKKTEQWLNDSKMNEYLRPETLFGSKFESYLNQNGKENEIIPEWFNKTFKKEEMTEDERREFEAIKNGTYRA